MLRGVSVFFSLLGMCLVISGGASPWLSFTAPNTPALTFGLLTFCSGGNCVNMSQAPYTGDLCELKAAAAFLFMSFIFSFFSFATGAALASGTDALIADIKLKMVFSTSALGTCFIGTVIGCNQVRGRAGGGARRRRAFPDPTPLPSSLAGLCLLPVAKQQLHVPGQRAKVRPPAGL